MEIFTRNVGMNRGTPRIWLEGKKLDAVGFIARARYTIKTLPNSIKLILCEDGEKGVSGKNISPDYRMPVIDLHNAGLADWLQGCVTVEVSLKPGQITIRRTGEAAIEDTTKPQPHKAKPAAVAAPVAVLAVPVVKPKPKPEPIGQGSLF